jgi:hypothetical protein
VKPLRVPVRERSRALFLRAQADEAARALETWGGDTGPEARPSDRARWEQLVRSLADKIAAADRAERRERADRSARCAWRRATVARVALLAVAARMPAEELRAALARLPRAGQLAKRPEVGDGCDVHGFVRCLRCGAAERLSRTKPGELRAAGWGSRVVDGAKPRREWLCPECWERPVLVVAPVYRVGERAAARLRAWVDRPARRRRFEAALARLAEVEPERAEAWREAAGV